MNIFRFSRIRSFFFGLTLPAQAIKLILSKPKLLLLCIIPIVITLCLYGFVFSAFQERAHTLLYQYFYGWGLNPEGWLGTVILFFSKILLLLFGALTFSIVANIASCPFNDFLAEKTEAFALPSLPKVGYQSFSFRVKIQGLDLLKSVVATVSNLIAILLSWVPVVNVCALILSCLLITFQFTSYPQTRRGQGIRVSLLFIWRHLFACLGFGLSFLLLFAVPLLSCFFLPLAVVGGTLLVARGQDLKEFEPLL